MSSTKLLTNKEPEKKLLLSFKKRAGRARSGEVTVRHRGGGAKRLYRIIDFGQEKINIPAKVVALEYDPYRTAFIALLEYQDGEKRYVLAPQGLKVGDEVLTAEKTEIKPGNRMKLKNIPIGILIYNIELSPRQGGKLVRGAGTTAKILAHEGGYTHIEMPSKETRKIPEECFASIGSISHPEHRFEILGKAGRIRHLRRRPIVRGAAMNPVDHPHGGRGGGKRPIGLKHPKTPWGKIARGVKTRRRKHTDKYIIKRRK
jgi:large subunit ribosomal protein L2